MKSSGMLARVKIVDDVIDIFIFACVHKSG